MDKRDKILDLIKVWGTVSHQYNSPDAEGLLALLSQEGVVIKVDRECEGFDCETGKQVNLRYVAVEPLIK